MPDDPRTLADAGVTLLSQQPQTVPDGNGSYVHAIVVRFRTARNAIGVVNVPVADYTADTARAQVLHLADQLDAL